MAALADVTDPHLVFDLRAKLDAAGHYGEFEVERVVAVELKLEKFSPAHKGQMELMDLDSANIRVAQYLPALPDVQVLQAQLHRVLHRASRNQSLFVLRWSVV